LTFTERIADVLRPRAIQPGPGSGVAPALADDGVELDGEWT
jgi:hypothetical protein